MIVIAGFGFVGKAHYSVFEKIGTQYVDPKYTDAKLSDFPAMSGVICCVGTPSALDGSCDVSQVLQVLSQTPEHVPVLIKSTIDIPGWNLIKLLYPGHTIDFSPEFLRAESAVQDMQQLQYLIMSTGGAEQFWKETYERVYTNLEFLSCNPLEAIAIKYFENSFLATKLSFFNEMYDFCDHLGLNFEAVRRGLAMDRRITESHTFVDPQQQLRGWGGHCFPKDTSALLAMAKLYDVDLTTLQAAVEYNRKLRPDV